MSTISPAGTAMCTSTSRLALMRGCGSTADTSAVSSRLNERVGGKRVAGERRQVEFRTSSEHELHRRAGVGDEHDVEPAHRRHRFDELADVLQHGGGSAAGRRGIRVVFARDVEG